MSERKSNQTKKPGLRLIKGAASDSTLNAIKVGEASSEKPFKSKNPLVMQLLSLSESIDRDVEEILGGTSSKYR